MQIVWKCFSVLRRRHEDPNDGNLPVTTHSSDPQKHPYHPRMAPPPRGRYGDVLSRHEQARSHRRDDAPPYQESVADMPRRPGPLAGNSDYRSSRDTDRAHHAGIHESVGATHRNDFDSGEASRSERPKQAYEHSVGSKVRESRGDPEARQNNSREQHRHHGSRQYRGRGQGGPQDYDPAVYQQGFESVPF